MDYSSILPSVLLIEIALHLNQQEVYFKLTTLSKYWKDTITCENNNGQRLYINTALRIDNLACIKYSNLLIKYSNLYQLQDTSVDVLKKYLFYKLKSLTIRDYSNCEYNHDLFYLDIIISLIGLANIESLNLIRFCAKFDHLFKFKFVKSLVLDSISFLNSNLDSTLLSLKLKLPPNLTFLKLINFTNSGFKIFEELNKGLNYLFIEYTHKIFVPDQIEFEDIEILSLESLKLVNHLTLKDYIVLVYRNYPDYLSFLKPFSNCLEFIFTNDHNIKHLNFTLPCLLVNLKMMKITAESGIFEYQFETILSNLVNIEELYLSKCKVVFNDHIIIANYNRFSFPRYLTHLELSLDVDDFKSKLILPDFPDSLRNLKLFKITRYSDFMLSRKNNKNMLPNIKIPKFPPSLLPENILIKELFDLKKFKS